MQIDPYNFELCRFKAGAFFETQTRPIDAVVCSGLFRFLRSTYEADVTCGTNNIK